MTRLLGRAALAGVFCSAAQCSGYGESKVLQLYTEGAPVLEVGDTLTVYGQVLTLLSESPTETRAPGSMAAPPRNDSASGIRFSSSPPAYATVDSISGLVTALSPGSATIRALDPAHREATVSVAIGPRAARVGIVADVRTPLAVGASGNLTFNAYDASGSAVDSVPVSVSFSNTTGLAWSLTARNDNLPQRTPVSVKYTVLGKADAWAYERRLYVRSAKVFVDSIHIVSAP